MASRAVLLIILTYLVRVIRIAKKEKKKGEGTVAFTAVLVLVVPEKSGIVAFACYAELRCQEEERRIVRLQTAVRR